jgi:ribose/xylose/arabinose/galactoside ABC-type transport system permease subunit
MSTLSTRPAPAATPADGPGPERRWVPSFDAAFVPGLILAVGIYLSVASPYFLTSRNISQILMQGAVLGIVAVGATFVIIGGDLDLSVGYNVALSGVFAAKVMTETGSWPVGLVAGVLCGSAIGLVNGVLATVLRVPSFVATLGTGTVTAGLALYLTSGVTISGLPEGFGALAKSEILGLQSMVWFMLLLFLLGSVLLHRTNYGIRVFATGGNRDAAFLAGIRTGRVRLTGFVIAGLCAGIAGVLLTSRVQAGQPTVGTSLTLFATAAVILGGTSILGGQGSMLRTFAGLMLIAVVQNGLDILGVEYSLQQVAIGGVFVLAACSEAIRRR